MVNRVQLKTDGFFLGKKRILKYNFDSKICL